MSAAEHFDPENPVYCTCFNLRRAARAVTQMYDAALRSGGLRATQFTVLTGVVKAGPVPLTRLADLLFLERTTLTRNLRLLEKAGLVVSEPGPDRRERLLSATDEGKKRFQEALTLWHEAQASLVENLGKAEWTGLLGHLDGLIAALPASAAD